MYHCVFHFPDSISATLGHFWIAQSRNPKLSHKLRFTILYQNGVELKETLLFCASNRVDLYPAFDSEKNRIFFFEYDTLSHKLKRHKICDLNKLL